ncbi:MAG: hypothetical protein Q8Q48_02895, partial [Candidatus Staskawiczbacteria bacterium]|nr:hypothetical protein [Candidatus Staskawiczbacteria bacterium]
KKIYKMGNKETKICQNCKKDFIIEPDDFAFYEKMKVPPPTFCPECRKQRRLSWRNDFNLYNNSCKLCGKSIVTLFSPESKMTVYCNKCWWSDKWDPRDYGADYDSSKTFFGQMQGLIQKVPVLATVNDDGIGSINSEYTHDFAFSKNCYMVFVAWKIENVLYSYYTIAGKDMVDCTNIMDFCQFIYEGLQLEQCSRVKWSQNCISCLDSAFLYDCRDCSNCFLCAGLRHKKYYFKNKQHTKEEYQKIIDSYQIDTWSGSERAKKELEEFIMTIPRKFSNNKQCYNCTGDFLINGKNSKHCFNVQKPENDKWIENADSPKDSYDLSIGGELSECYEGITCDQSNKNLFGIFSWKSRDIQYTHHCHSSHDLFGCVGLRNAEYCILNKQYSKEEYEKLRSQIISDMNSSPYVDARGMQYKFGEFYPTELSYFAYNETMAQEQFPLEREEALKNNWKWQDSLQRTTGKETIQPEDIPESIEGVKDDIVKEVLRCIDCSRNYKIVEAELALYRKMKVPIPRRCFCCRLSARLKKRNSFKLWHRKCMKPGCINEFETSYSPDRPEIVYCEQCYNSEVA